ncbi:unnamed protein product [Fraxinus pennsylvanica]|uniref:Cytochrome P450 n=1 Tax=Fraxinus pennsylvanica TaxID=56036 RepID=A0AAD2DWG4_9LAMI|nr:unnamed protein product [Fraxinus pennsylvanica]
MRSRVGDQWIVANLVKHPDIQSKLYSEITGKWRAWYLKATLLEALRRHLPGHFVLPHRVTKEVELDGYMIPKNRLVNFMVADLVWDLKVWKDLIEFKSDRFLANGGEEFDIMGSREIKMMPFGVGRRICLGWGLALLHMEYFVANSIWYFEWTSIQEPTTSLGSDNIEMSEKQEFTTVMKNPLRARISPRMSSV